MSDLTTDAGSTTTGGSSSSSASGTAAVAKDSAAQVAGTAKDSAKEGAKDVAAEAGRQASQLASQASAQARDAASQATSQLKDQASQQTARAAEGMRSLSGQLQALAEGRPDDAGAVGDYARQAKDKLDELAGRLDEGGFEGVLDDVQRFARRRPGLFLLGAGALGFAVGRAVRGSKVVSGDSGNGSQAMQRQSGYSSYPSSYPAAGAIDVDLSEPALPPVPAGPTGDVLSGASAAPSFSPGTAPGSPGSL